MRKKFVILLLPFSIVLLGLIVFNRVSETQQQRKEVPSHNRLKWYASEGKREGRGRVTIPAPMVEYLGSANRNIEQVLNDYTFVVAQPVTKRTLQIDDNNLITWYKFRIEETLSPVRSPACPSCVSLSPPADLPIDYNSEFLIPRGGGIVTIDDVEVEQTEAGSSEFKDNQKYLLVISLYANRVAYTAGGPLGVFEINPNEHLTAISKSSNIISDGVKSKFDNSLTSLRARLKRE